MQIDLSRPTDQLSSADRIALINAMRERLAAAEAGTGPRPSPEELRYSLLCLRIERSRSAPAKRNATTPQAPARPLSVEEL